MVGLHVLPRNIPSSTRHRVTSGAAAGPFVDFASITPYPVLSRPEEAPVRRRVSCRYSNPCHAFSRPIQTCHCPPVDPSETSTFFPWSPDPFVREAVQSAVGGDTSAPERSSKKPRRGAAQPARIPVRRQLLLPQAARVAASFSPQPDADKMQGDQVFGGQPDFGGASQQARWRYPRNSLRGSRRRHVRIPDAGSAAAPSAFNGSRRAFWDPGSKHEQRMEMRTSWRPRSPSFAPRHPRPRATARWALGLGKIERAVPGDRSSTRRQPRGHPRQQRRRVNLQESPSMPQLDTSGADSALFTGAYPTPIDDPFGIVSNGGVNPGCSSPVPRLLACRRRRSTLWNRSQARRHRSLPPKPLPETPRSRFFPSHPRGRNFAERIASKNSVKASVIAPWRAHLSNNPHGLGCLEASARIGAGSQTAGLSCQRRLLRPNSPLIIRCWEMAECTPTAPLSPNPADPMGGYHP